MRRCLLALLAWAGFSCQNGAEIRQRSDFTADWRFALDADGDFSDPDFDDSAWQRVTVPHDWAIYGPFDIGNDPQFVAIEQDGETVPSLKAGRTGGLPVVGPGWYRIRFDVPDFAAGTTTVKTLRSCVAPSARAPS